MVLVSVWQSWLERAPLRCPGVAGPLPGQDLGMAGLRDGRMRVQLSLHSWLAPGSGRKQRTIIFSQGCFDTRALLSRNAI